jgi:excisionase family DNA binding protein
MRFRFVRIGGRVVEAADLRQTTYLPEADDADDLATVFDFLRAHEVARSGSVADRYLLIGTGVGEQVELPVEVYRVLRRVVEAMSSGLAVTVAPSSQSLTTQQAADLLGVSRPTLVRFLDQGRIPYERTGSHRRLLLRDVLNFREQRRQEEYAELEAMSVPIDEEDDLAETLTTLRHVRKEAAARRRAQ